MGITSTRAPNMGKSCLPLVWYPMSSANSHDSINPKPLMVGIAEEPPRQLAPSVRSLLVVGTTSANRTTSTAASPTLEDPICFGSFEFTPHPPSLLPYFNNLQGAGPLAFGSFNYCISSSGVLRLPDPISSGPGEMAAVPTASSASVVALQTIPQVRVPHEGEKMW